MDTIDITFNAFSFLQKTFKEKGFPYANVILTVKKGTTPNDLLFRFGLTKKDIECVFINGKVLPFDTKLHAGDRVALVPPGTPGPYRVHLGMTKNQNR